MDPYPLAGARILFKTFAFDLHAISNFDYLLQEAITGESGEGYCEKLVDDMMAVSNQVVCGGYTTNVGYYFRINFPLGLSNTAFSFRTPTDFGMGGVILVDGKEVVQLAK
jgi:hypothetical protein